MTKCQCLSMLWHGVIQISPGCKFKRSWWRNGIPLWLSIKASVSLKYKRLLSKLALTFHRNLPLSRPSAFLMGSLTPLLQLLTFMLILLCQCPQPVPAPAQLIPCQGHRAFTAIVEIHLIHVLPLYVMNPWCDFVGFETCFLIRIL